MAIKRITTNLIQDVSIGTIDIANNAITAAKITDGNITTAKLADLNVTAGKLAGTLDLTGKTITVATATTGDSDTSPASTAFVQQEIAALVDSSPSSLNTLNELAAALGDDASFSTTVTNSIALKAPLASPTFTGNVGIGTSSPSTDFHVVQSNTTLPTIAGDTVGILQSNGTAALSVISGSGNSVIRFGDSADENAGQIRYVHGSDKLDFTTNAQIAMTIDSSGNVGIGTTSPAQLLDIAGTAPNIRFTDTRQITWSGSEKLGGVEWFTSDTSANGVLTGASIYCENSVASTLPNFNIVFATQVHNNSSAPIERMRVDSNGKVGIGVTPKTDWDTGYNAIQIGESSAFFANGSADEVFMSQNARWTSGGWKYNSSGTATLFDMQSGNTRWRRAASGSDDGTISWSDSMFIDTSGHVGIGTTSPTVDLDVSGPSSSMVLPGTSGTTPKGFLRLGYNDRTWGGTEILMGVINDGNVGYASYLQAKVPTDYSVNRTFIINPQGGNLLVGTTSTTVGAGGSGVSGFRVDSDNGIVQAAASGNPSAIFNRTTSNGSLISCRYNGVEVGNIQTEGGDALVIQSGTTSGSGLLFHPSNGQIYPVRNSVKIDNAIDLGRSVNRFKDIYLSGGVNFSANANASGMSSEVLDDYEEGTWTPTFGGASGTYVGKYTKIGDTVHLFYHFLMSGGMPTSTAQVQIGGLPFTSSSSYLSSGSIYARYYTPNDSTLTTIIMDNESVIRLVNTNDQSFDYTTYGELEASHNNAVYIIGQITYTV